MNLATKTYILRAMCVECLNVGNIFGLNCNCTHSAQDSDTWCFAGSKYHHIVRYQKACHL